MALDLPTPHAALTLEAHRSFASAEADWRAFESRAAGHPYQRFGWLSAWHECIGGRDAEPFIVVLRDRGEMRMLLPLAIERRLGAKRLVPMGAPVCDYHAPLADPLFAQQLTTAAAHRVLTAAAALAGVDYVLLTQVPPTLGRTCNPFAPICHGLSGGNAHAASLGPDWPAYYAARRGSKTRSRLRSKEKALANLGPINFGEVRDPVDRAQLVAEIMALKDAQLRAHAGEFNTFARREVAQFFRTLAGAADGNVFVFRLRAGKVLLAAVLALVRDGCFYYQVPVYPALELQRFSPGQVMITRLMEWAIGHGCTRFDFTVGDEPYKAEWSDETWALRCGAWPRTARGWVGAAVSLAQLAVLQQVKKRPSSYAFAVRVRNFVGRLRRLLGAAHV